MTGIAEHARAFLVCAAAALVLSGCGSAQDTAPDEAAQTQPTLDGSVQPIADAARDQASDVSHGGQPDGASPDATTDAAGAVGKIRPGLLWNDDQGNPIHAHGGNVIKVGGKWYWYGENVRDTSTGLQYGSFGGVSCYSSTDLQIWHHEGIVCAPRATGPLSKDGGVAYRPKVLYNSTTSKYVMVLTECCPAAGHFVFAVSDSPVGPFTYVGTQSGVSDPTVMDMGVFQEADGTAYAVYSANNRGVGIDRLAGDYLSAAVSAASFTDNGACEEAPGIVKVGGRYFLTNSWCSGWSSNQNHYRSATSVSGPWPTAPDGNLGDQTTYDSQGGFILTVQGTTDTTYVYMGDRWNCSQNNCDISAAQYVWLPLTISGGAMTLDWYDTWYINVVTGAWSTSP